MPIPDTGADGRLFSIPPAADPDRYARVLDHARRLYAYTGTISLDRIRGRYDRWYRAHHRELQGLDDRDRLGGFWGRLETYVLKIAALHQLALTTSQDGAPPADHVFVLEQDALDASITLVEHLKKSLVRFMRQDLAAKQGRESPAESAWHRARRWRPDQQRNLQTEGESDDEGLSRNHARAR